MRLHQSQKSKHCLHILNRRSHYKKNLVILSCYSHQIKRPIKFVVLIGTTMQSNIFVTVYFITAHCAEAPKRRVLGHTSGKFMKFRSLAKKTFPAL